MEKQQVEKSTINTSGYINWSSQMIASDEAVKNLEEFLSQFHDDDHDSNNPTSVKNLHSMKPCSLILKELKNKQIIELNLSNNRLRNEGIVQSAEELQFHPELRMISIAKNDVGNRSIKYLLSKIIFFPNLEYVDIRENFGSNPRCIREFRESLPLDLQDSQKDLFMQKIVWKGDLEIEWS